MFKNFAVALSFLLPTFAAASNEIDMSCGQSVKAFFAPLVQGRLINTKPISVNQDTSINVFDVRVLKPLTAHGMPVRMVYGFTDEPLLFTNTGNSKQDVYGVIVKEGIANVQAQLNSLGETRAFTRRFDGQSTMTSCKGE
ncbi:MAG: hypothetical protein I4O49_04800 [Janthinobacterium lividum]|nr:hypothetical protein [Janthinobacterium lividum]